MHTLSVIKDYMLAGVTPHWVWFALGTYALAKDLLPKVDKIKANSPLELVFNQANKLLLPILGKFPAVGPFLSLLDTPEDAGSQAAADSPPVSK